MINELIKLATHLDKMGHHREADYLDAAIRKFAKGPCGPSELVLNINFAMGKAELGPAWTAQAAVAKCMIEHGMTGDEDFITLVGGVSAVGGNERNRELMFERKEQALEFLARLGAEGPLPGGQTGAYDIHALNNKVDPDWEFDTIEPGTVMGGVRVPSEGDPGYDAFFRQYQFVRVVIKTPSRAGDIDALARKFVAATDRPGTNEDDVYDVLEGLRHAKDFHAFNKSLRVITGRNFYQIACDAVKVPGFLSTMGYSGGSHTTQLGPSELGGDRTINMWLKLNGLPELPCAY